MRYSDKADDIGTKLGPKLVKLISDTIVATKVKLLDTEHRARTHSMQTIIDRAGQEVADLIRPVFEDALNDQDMPDEVRTFLQQSLSGKHQWQAIAGMVIGYSGAGSTLSQIVSNTLAPVTRDLIGRRPQLIPDNATIAQLAAKQIVPEEYYLSQAAGQGWDGFVSQGMLESFTAYPDVTTTIEMLRRGLIDTVTAEFFLKRSATAGAYIGDILSLRDVLLPPADLADMVVRGIKTHGEAEAIAAKSGVSASDFNAMVLDTGEPPGPQQLLEAFRRGFIDQARLVRGILQSRIRDEWVDVIEKLGHSPMSVADAVNAVVQGHLDMATGSKYADYNGLEPGMFNILYQTAGEPLSRTEMEDLYNRGEVTQADVEQALRESRLKNKYIKSAFALHQRIPPPREVHTMLTNGSLTHEQALKLVMDYGYSADIAKAVVAAGTTVKVDPWKREVITATMGLYEESAISADHARATIKSMGYADTEAAFIIEAAELRRQARTLTTGISAIRSKYLGRHISANAAKGLLSQIGIPADRRDYLMAIWDIDRAANVRTLTEAQVVKAVKLQLIDPAEGVTRLVAMGYDETDAGLLIEGA